MVNYLVEGISYYLHQHHSITVDELRGKGLSIFDQFYAQVRSSYGVVFTFFLSCLLCPPFFRSAVPFALLPFFRSAVPFALLFLSPLLPFFSLFFTFFI
jgi:hypothetical protein